MRKISVRLRTWNFLVERTRQRATYTRLQQCGAALHETKEQPHDRLREWHSWIKRYVAALHITLTSVVASWLLPSSQSVLGSCSIHSSSFVSCSEKRPASKLPVYSGSLSSWKDITSSVPS